jgi:hypothetical protein
MLGWKLWRQISQQAERPPENPAHRRMIGSAAPSMPFALECAMLLLVPIIMLPAIIFTSAVYGIRWSALISQSLAREKTAGRFDLLALTPGGAFGTAWLMTCGAIQRTGMLYVLETPLAWMIRGLMSLAIFWVLGLTGLFTYSGMEEGEVLVALLFGFVVLLAALWVDHLHSVGLAALIGLLAPTYTTRTADAGLLAVTIYTMLQLTTYAITGLAGFALLPDILGALNVPGIVTALLLPVIRLAILFVLRELLIIYLWTLVQQQYNANAADVDAVNLPVTRFEAAA